MKKTLQILIIGLIIPFIALGQNDNTNGHLLWEINHTELDGPSYLFGSIHLNDSRVFIFDDTLHQALMSCSQFANEIDLSNIDSLLVAEIVKEFNNEESELSNSDAEADDDDDDDDDNPFQFDFDVNGELTTIDLFLQVAADQAGLSSHGLEALEDQLDLFNDLDKEASQFEYGTPAYEEFIKHYALRDIQSIQNICDQYAYEEDLDMINRNEIQAKAFQQLMATGNTFGVVGLAHLFGDANVLDILTKKGYSIRRMKYGKPSNAIETLYNSRPKKDWFTVTNPSGNLQLQSKTNNPIQDFNNQGEIHISVEFSKGLIYFSGFFPPANIEEKSIIESMASNFFSDTSELVIHKPITTNGQAITRFESQSEKSIYKGQLNMNNQTSAIHFVVGFSKKSIQHPNVERYLNSLTLHEKEIQDWTSQRSEIGGYDYYFPAGIEYQTLKTKMVEYEQNGEAIVYYKTFVNPENKNEYLLRHVTAAPGIIYLNPYESIESMNALYESNYKASSKKTSYSFTNENLTCDATLIDEYDNAFYIKTIVRGSVMYNLIQKSPSQKRDELFFNGLKLLSPQTTVDQEFSYDDAQFFMATPTSNSNQHATKNPESTIDAFGINSSQSGINIDIEFDEYTPYEMNRLEESLFTTDLLDTTTYDSLIYFKKYKYEDICPGFISSYQSDSTYLIHTEIGIYCNNHFVDINITSPKEHEKSDIVDKIINSFHFDNPSTASITSNKTETIINDVMSTDTTVFRGALAAITEGPLFTTENIPSVIKTLESTVLDEEEDYNSKYQLITSFHDIKSAELENALFEVYRKTNNYTVQHRILESLSARETTNATDKMITLLQQPKLNNQYPEDLLHQLNDSLELFEHYYPQLKSIAEINSVDNTALHTIVNWYTKDTSELFNPDETLWLTDKINHKIEEYYTNSLVDTSASIQEYIMDFVEIEDLESEEQLYTFLSNSQDVFGQYRSIYSMLLNKQPVPNDLLEKVMSSEYYKYWLLVNYEEEKMPLPDKYLDKHSVAKIVMKKNIYNGFEYWCDTCTIIKEYTNDEIKYGDMYLIKCDSVDEGDYFIGCVGPFNQDGQFSFYNDESVYYENIQTAKNPFDLEKELVDYLNKE